MLPKYGQAETSQSETEKKNHCIFSMIIAFLFSKGLTGKIPTA